MKKNIILGLFGVLLIVIFLTVFVFALHSIFEEINTILL